jgi:ketosteroid isomerase-like protein
LDLLDRLLGHDRWTTTQLLERCRLGVNEQYVVECQHVRTNRPDGPNLDQQLCVLWSFADGKIVSGQHLAADQDGLDAFYTALLKG